MKTFVALLALLAFAGSSFAQNTIRIDVSPDASTKKDDTKKADAQKADAKKKKEEPPPPPILGMIIPRADGRLLAIRIVDDCFRLSFFDAKKKKTPPDFAKAALRWKPRDRLTEEHDLLTPGGDDHSLTSARNIRPPWNFKLFISLLNDSADGNDTVGESYVIDFAQ